MEKAYQPGMTYNVDWSRQKKAAFIAARRKFRGSGTKEALKDKVAMVKEVYERRKAEGNMDTYKSVNQTYIKEKRKLSAME